MNYKEIEALVMARPDMAQAVFYDIVPMGAFVELARAVEAAERERCAMQCENLTIANPGRADLTADQCALEIREYVKLPK